ncbi:acyltransferase family protein [Pseudomonas sp. Pseu.R1]|uniref:acyltransferase family protein n=1 Tax=Pseudomonas sp. Pseu.R1 TaxID=3379818 RepID=UPI003B942D7B
MTIFKSSASSGHVGYRPDIDGLRALAVLGVLLYHAFPSALTGGFIGVDVFFVISGFIISSNLYKELSEGVFSFAGFYKRRIRRIFPALALVMLFVMGGGWFSLFSDEYRALSKHVLYGAGFSANFGYFKESGYFDIDAVTKPLLHLWSLGIEEQFYFVWPVVLIAAWRSRVSIYGVLAILLALSFWSSIHLIRDNQVAAFYLPYSRFWELGLGALLAAGVHFHKERLHQVARYTVFGVKVANASSVAGLACISVGYIWAKENVHFPGYWALLPTLGCALVIFAGEESWLNRQVLAHRLLVVIGLISFPLYLWHWPLLSFAHVINGGLPPAWVRIVIAVASVLLAWLTFKYVERPLRYGAGNTKTYALVAAMAVVSVAAGVIFKMHGFPSRGFEAARKEATLQMVGPTWKYTKNDLCVSLYPGTFRYFCSQERPGSPTLILIGNSYANHLYGGLVEDSRFSRQNVLSYGSCEPGGYEIDCDMQERIVKDNPSIKFAIISMLWPRIDEQGRRVDMISGAEQPGGDNANVRYMKFLDEKLTFLKAHGVQSVIFLPKPEVTYDIRTCFSRPFGTRANNCEVDRRAVEAQQQGIENVIRQVHARHPDVPLFDQNKLFCDEEKCHLVQGGMPLLRDFRHYSEYGSRLIISQFAEWAKFNMPDVLD